MAYSAIVGRLKLQIALGGRTMFIVTDAISTAFGSSPLVTKGVR
jgi:hypothetical protein